ncbi:HD domain-containing protein [Paenibacillus cremeus]|uniref:HD domain-containing protein n=2 Tax=Paenibacillus cremeus TaxID=2163881 RepID=A0A559KDZ1_9BACL|nr:HD domain-containing protein [Paenibacillus cremeus]
MKPELFLFLQLGDAVIITDEQHHIRAVNDTYEKITGFSRENIIGVRAGFLRSNLTPPSTYDSMKMTLAQNAPWSGIFTNRTRHHELWHASITITPITMDNKLYYVGIFRNLNQLSDGSYISETRKAKIQNELLRTLAISCEVRDPAIEGHLVRVQQMTEKLARRLMELTPHALSEEYIRHLVNASILHDIGKSGIPESILYKPGGLTSYERVIIEMHPSIGVDILNKMISGLDDDLIHQEFILARNIIQSHHEKWDGTGYPNQLAGDDIPLEAQIVSLVDVYDALTSRRAYKDAWPHDQALDYIQSERGLSFNPLLTDAFATIDWIE